MAEHYYSNNPTTKSDEQLHDMHVAGLTLRLWTDHGTFSKGGLDYGSKVLIETVASQLSHALMPGRLLDVGCGYGPMGISLAKLLKRGVDMVDVNERSIALANRNAQAYGIEGQAFASNIYEQVSKIDYALIVSNPPIRAGKKVVHGIIADAINHLSPGGRLVIVIQKKQGAPSAKAKMAEVFGNVEELERDKGYWILASVKANEALA